MQQEKQALREEGLKCKKGKCDYDMDAASNAMVGGAVDSTTGNAVEKMTGEGCTASDQCLSKVCGEMKMMHE